MQRRVLLVVGSVYGVGTLGREVAQVVERVEVVHYGSCDIVTGPGPLLPTIITGLLRPLLLTIALLPHGST